MLIQLVLRLDNSLSHSQSMHHFRFEYERKSDALHTHVGVQCGGESLHDLHGEAAARRAAEEELRQAEAEVERLRALLREAKGPADRRGP